MDPKQRMTRARTAAPARHRPNDSQTVDLARDLKAELLAEYIQRVVEMAPPLTQEQRDKLAALLGGAVR